MRPSRRRRRAQGLIEWILLSTVLVIALVSFAKPLQDIFVGVSGRGSESVGSAGDVLLAQLPDDARNATPSNTSADDTTGNWISDAPQGGSSSGGSAAGGAGGSGGSGGGGGGGGGGGTIPIPAKVAAAEDVLLASKITFDLFDFVQGKLVTHAVADIVRLLRSKGIPIITGAIKAIAETVFQTKADGTVDTTQPVVMTFNDTWIATATTEAVAAVLTHEGWHATQVFNGIMNDVVHYPRVVDIEYEAFVAGAATWNTVQGAQRERNLDAGSGCVAAGEARCKEILVTDFGYPPGPRGGG